MTHTMPARVTRAAHGVLALAALLSSLGASRATAQGPVQGTTPGTLHPAAMPLPFAPALPGETSPPPIPREFRGVWIATVANIDWPSRPGLPSDSAKAELLRLLDRAAALRLNAVIFQVRPAADAFYASPYEPWSEYLTGTQGRAPEPFWDPLAFAIHEAHLRGLELHAWFNPYRARHRDTRVRAAATHVSRTMPSVVKPYGPYLWMDPGEARVREHTTRVILDVVRRYDVDGVHIDDYFYPYPERDRRGRAIPFPDAASWQRYRKSGGALSRDDWRRRNVDLLIEDLYEQIKQVKPWVKFGISPFGIWRPGHPELVRGLDAYTTLFADSRRWLAEGWLDYFAPQLYWSVDARQQSYPQLLDWWTSQNTRGRHLWPGNGTYKVTDRGSVQWPASEIVRQIDLTRAQPGADGNVHFNMSALVRDTDALASRLATGPYGAPALVPASPWLSSGTPPPPLVVRTDEAEGIVLHLESGPVAHHPRWWVIRSRYADGWRAQVVDATARTVVVPLDGVGHTPDVVAVNAVDRAGVESPTVLLSSRGTQ